MLNPTKTIITIDITTTTFTPTTTITTDITIEITIDITTVTIIITLANLQTSVPVTNTCLGLIFLINFPIMMTQYTSSFRIITIITFTKQFSDMTD